jgi:outer membrane murein-binding lipoprotein Lpp
VSDNWWTDRQQNKRIAGLEEDLGYMSSSLSAARASTARLKAELSKATGSLEQRLSRLSAAFDAFVEISDLRVTLALFHAHGRVRHQAKQLLAGQPIVDVADAEGYWLAPALVALRGVADGATDAEALALAEARDPLRTRAFQVLLSAELRGKLPEFTVAVQSLSEPVPRYQRAMWLLAADGHFGPEGWSNCATLLAGADKVSQSLSLEDTIRSLSAPSKAVEVPSDLNGAEDLVTALQSCERLTSLRSWVTKAMDAYTGEPTPEVDPLVRRSLDLLIDEGSPVELPLLVRERELRAVIEGTNASSSAWDGTVGRAVDLLKEDLSAEQPGRKALAIKASTSAVLSVATKLEAATHTKPPTSVTYRSRYGQVTITQSGAEEASLRKAIDTVGHLSGHESKGRQAAIACAAVAVAFIVLAFIAGWGWAVVALGLAGVGAYQWRHDTEQRKDAEQNIETLTARLHKDVETRVELLATTSRELQDRQARVTEDINALRAALATVTG